jgi:non-specific serine/threonine protein kinase
LETSSLAHERTGSGQAPGRRYPLPDAAFLNDPYPTYRELREREVARLLAAGRSNREIAETVVISEGTVEVHVKHILGKLDLRSRAQVAVWAANQPL